MVLVDLFQQLLSLLKAQLIVPIAHHHLHTIQLLCILTLLIIHLAF